MYAMWIYEVANDIKSNKITRERKHASHITMSSSVKVREPEDLASSPLVMLPPSFDLL